MYDEDSDEDRFDYFSFLFAVGDDAPVPHSVFARNASDAHTVMDVLVKFAEK